MRSKALIRSSVLALIVATGTSVAGAAASRHPTGRHSGTMSLTISEIMYHPRPGGAEFIELLNFGDSTIDLSGVAFTDGISFTFPPGSSLAPGEYAVLASPEDDFEAVYPTATVMGWYDGRLDNGGETVTLQHGDGSILCSLTYDDDYGWPINADGRGYSLVLITPGSDVDEVESWRASAVIDGTPGEADVGPGIPKVLVNEALTHTDLPQRDAVELYNSSAQTADIRGWLLTDDLSEPKKAKIPDDAAFILAPGAYAVLDERVFAEAPGTLNGSTLPGFLLSSHGDEEIYLFSADSAGSLTGYAHGFRLSAAQNGVSFGRYVTSDGTVHFVAQSQLTLGQENAGPKVGPVIISEIYYHPTEQGGIEYLLLENVSDATVNLWDDQEGGDPGNRWMINGIGFTFPAGVSLASGEQVLVVNSDPDDFRSAYSVPAATAIYGPFGNTAADQTASLSNGGETVTLLWPDAPDEGVVPYIVMDRVAYDDRSPWPPADGNGLALSRRSSTSFGNDPASWETRQPCFTPQGCGVAGDESELLFDPSRVMEVEVAIDPADWEELRIQQRNYFDLMFGSCLDQPFPKPFTYFPGTVWVDGVEVDNVGIRTKGYLGSYSYEKPALKISLDEYVEGQRLYGKRLLTLNNNVQDGSYVNQCVGYDMLAAAGITVPRCSFARVTVNGQDMGIYTHVESIKEGFLDRAFGTTSGNLYEGTFSDFRQGWTGTFERKTNRSSTDISDIQAVVDALGSDDEQLEDALDQVIDLDDFYTYWAMDVLIGNWDGYVGKANNFYIYHDPATSRFQFIPWGIDQILSEDYPYGQSAGETGVFVGGAIAYRLYQYPPTQLVYANRVRQLLDTVWHEQQWVDRLYQYVNLIRPYLTIDQRNDIELYVFARQNFIERRRNQILAAIDPSPPEWTEPLQSPPCLAKTGTLSASFETSWGTITAPNWYEAGSGTITATVDGQEMESDIVAVVAGNHPNAYYSYLGLVILQAYLGDNDYLIVYLVTDPQLVTSGAEIELDNVVTYGELYFADLDISDEVYRIGLLGKGDLELVEGGSTTGDPVSGTFSCQVFADFD